MSYDDHLIFHGHHDQSWGDTPLSLEAQAIANAPISGTPRNDFGYFVLHQHSCKGLCSWTWHRWSRSNVCCFVSLQQICHFATEYPLRPCSWNFLWSWVSGYTIFIRPQPQFYHEHLKLVGRSKSSNVDPTFSKCTYRRVFLISHASMSSVQALVVTNFYPCAFKVQQLDPDYFLDLLNNLRFETGSQWSRQSRYRSTPRPESNINDMLPRFDLKFRLTSGPIVHHENVMSLQILERSKSIYVLFTETGVLKCLHKQLCLISQNLNNISEYACSTNRLLRFRQSCSAVAQ